MIEFWSSERGGTWKPGVVDSIHNPNKWLRSLIRIQVGDGVYIIRAASKCRKINSGV